MMAAVLAFQLTASPSVATVRYAHVPPEIVRISVLRWQEAGPPVAATAEIEHTGRRLVVRAASGRRSVVVLERADGAYLLDGPFSWPPADAERALDRRWRRTIVGDSREPIADGSLFEWVSASPDRTGEWPKCLRTGERIWTCWGAAAGEPGVIVYRSGDRIWWTVVSRTTPSSPRGSRWGRLLLVRDTSGDPSGLRVTLGHPVAPSSRRQPGVRLDTAVVTGAQSTPVAPGVAWLSGEDVPPGAWVDVRTAHSGPTYLELQDVADGPASAPLTVLLDETLMLEGIALGDRDQPASGALVTLFRLIDHPFSSTAWSEKPRRVLVTETIADAGGAFHIDGLGGADYEVVAWHPQLGRASSPAPRKTGVFSIRLESPGIVRGRVLSAGKPVGGVDVISFPEAQAFRNAGDLVELKGGDMRTGADGRFAVMLASGGGGELRVGGAAFPIKRIPLPRVPGPLLDLGDIDLGSPLEITIVLDQDTSCGVRATGPIGQSGLQIATATRTATGLFRLIVPEPGLWAFELLCGRDERVLSPTMVQISPAHAGKEMRFSVR
jgi:hypothetical protein